MRRRPSGAIALVVLLVLASCGNGTGEETPGSPRADGPGTTGTTRADESPEPSGGPGVTGGPGPGTPPGAPATVAPPAPPPTSGAVAPTAPRPGAVGAFAGFYLRPAASSRIVIETRSQAGAEPQPATTDHARSVLAAASAKAVEVDPRRIEGGARSWTEDDLRDLADRSSARIHGEGGVAVVRLLFLRGDFRGDAGVLGVAVRSDVAAVFVDQVRAAAGPLVSSDAIEDAVTIHEVGHLLGLVDNFLDTGRDDPEHPGHSRNEKSVMYWAVESSLVGQVLSGGPPRDFDAQDRADLDTIRRSAA